MKFTAQTPPQGDSAYGQLDSFLGDSRRLRHNAGDGYWRNKHLIYIPQKEEILCIAEYFVLTDSSDPTWQLLTDVFIGGCLLLRPGTAREAPGTPPCTRQNPLLLKLTRKTKDSVCRGRTENRACRKERLLGWFPT